MSQLTLNITVTLTPQLQEKTKIRGKFYPLRNKDSKSPKENIAN